jgi:hypothetical protein
MCCTVQRGDAYEGQGSEMDVASDFRTNVELFMNMKGMSVLEFSDGDWIYEVAVPIDVTVYECL